MLNRERMNDVLRLMEGMHGAPWSVQVIAQAAGLSTTITRGILDCLEAAGEVEYEMVKTQTPAQKRAKTPKGMGFVSTVAHYRLVDPLKPIRQKLREIGKDSFVASIQRCSGRTTRMLRHAAVLAETGASVVVVMANPGGLEYAKGFLTDLGTTPVQVVTPMHVPLEVDFILYDHYQETPI